MNPEKEEVKKLLYFAKKVVKKDILKKIYIRIYL
jgi:hypothetical protein